MSFTSEEYKIYLKVQYELLLEEAKNAVKDYIADVKGVCPWDIYDEEAKRFDLEYLVKEYELKMLYENSNEQTWNMIVENYFDDIDLEEA